MQKLALNILLILSPFVFFSCCNHVTPKEPNSGASSGSQGIPSPKAIIYKTKADYSKNVPVILNDQKDKIVSYPDIKDIKNQGENVYPTQLAEGYLLDNRGIGPNVAFLKYTYEEYQNLEQTPKTEELMLKIVDKDPIVEMYEGLPRNKYQNAESELNELIISKKITSYRRIK